MKNIKIIITIRQKLKKRRIEWDFEGFGQEVLMGWDRMGMHVSYMAWHGKQILKGNQKKLATTPPTCSRYGKRHMISHLEEKGPSADVTCISWEDLDGPTSLFLSAFIQDFLFSIFSSSFVFLDFCIKYSSGGDYCLLFCLLHCLPCNSKSSWKICKIWDEIWSDLTLWDVDICGSCFITKLLSSSPPPIEETPTQQKPNS